MRPTSAVKAASNIKAVEKVMVSAADIESAFTAKLAAKMMRSKSIAVVRVQSVHRGITVARAAAQLCKGASSRGNDDDDDHHHDDAGGGGGGDGDSDGGGGDRSRSSDPADADDSRRQRPEAAEPIPDGDVSIGKVSGDEDQR